MKLPFPFATRAAAALALGLLAGASHAQESRSGTIKSIQGDVAVVRGEARRPALPGDGVAVQDRIVTGPASAAALTLRDGTALMVGPGSTVNLTSFRYESDKQEGSMALFLLKGSLRFITGLIGQRHPEQVSISTTTLTVGIRGTDFIVEAP
jgi:hypothetical protein